MRYGPRRRWTTAMSKLINHSCCSSTAHRGIYSYESVYCSDASNTPTVATRYYLGRESFRDDLPGLGPGLAHDHRLRIGDGLEDPRARRILLAAPGLRRAQHTLELLQLRVEPSTPNFLLLNPRFRPVVITSSRVRTFVVCVRGVGGG